MSRWQARITTSNETRSVEFDLVISACQLDVIRHFRSRYCYNIYMYHCHSMSNTINIFANNDINSTNCYLNWNFFLANLVLSYMYSSKTTVNWASPRLTVGFPGCNVTISCFKTLTKLDDDITSPPPLL